MSKRIVPLLVAALALTRLIAGCRNPFSPSPLVCPTTSDSITTRSYGSYVFGHVGDDEMARQIIANCGWHVWRGNDGGFGHQLIITSPDSSVKLLWSWNNLEAAWVGRGYRGVTNRGTRLGDSQAAVLSANAELATDRYTTLWLQGFMDADEQQTRAYTSADECVHVEATFDSPGGVLIYWGVENVHQFYGGAPGIAECDPRWATNPP